MQAILKTLLSDLHKEYFKPNSFKKVRHRFRRQVGPVIQEVEFQSSQWNSARDPVFFYVNLSIGFEDLPQVGGIASLPGSGRMEGLVPHAPRGFEVENSSYEQTRSELLSLLPLAIAELPRHYEGVYSRAKAGYHTHIPLPETWRNDLSEDRHQNGCPTEPPV